MEGKLHMIVQLSPGVGAPSKTFQVEAQDLNTKRHKIDNSLYFARKIIIDLTFGSRRIQNFLVDLCLFLQLLQKNLSESESSSTSTNFSRQSENRKRQLNMRKSQIV